MEKRSIFRPLPSKYIVFTADYILPFSIIVAFIAAAYLTLYSGFFQVRHIECVLDFEPCQDLSVIAELDKMANQNIFRLNPEIVITRLTSGDFTIREAMIKKELPDKVRITLESVYPVVALQTETQNQWVVLDERLRVIATRSTDPNVPTVILTKPLTLTIGKPLADPDVIYALNTSLKIAKELIGIKSIKLVDENTLELKLDDSLIAIMTPKKDELLQLRTLQAILADDTISKEVNTIDVRFSQPVLR